MHKMTIMADRNWNHDEFICFLLIYTSHVDMEFSDEEKAKLRTKFQPEMFDRQLATFNGMNDYQALDTILKCKDTCYPTAEDKQQLLETIKEQFFVDGDFSDFEKEIYHFLERIL